MCALKHNFVEMFVETSCIITDENIKSKVKSSVEASGVPPFIKIALYLIGELVIIWLSLTRAHAHTNKI